MFITFNLVPFFLLCLYPCRCFQSCLNHCRLNSQVAYLHGCFSRLLQVLSHMTVDTGLVVFYLFLRIAALTIILHSHKVSSLWLYVEYWNFHCIKLFVSTNHIYQEEIQMILPDYMEYEHIAISTPYIAQQLFVPLAKSLANATLQTIQFGSFKISSIELYQRTCRESTWCKSVGEDVFVVYALAHIN